MGMQILSINIRTLKIFGLWPLEQYGWNTNLFLAVLQQVLMALDVSASIAAITYQCLNGFEDVIAMIEALIGICDYLGYLFIYACFLYNYKTIRTLIEQIDIFLQYCSHDVIENADMEFRRYTKLMLGYFAFGLFFNSALPLVFRGNCNELRDSEYYVQHDPCGMPSRNWYPFDASRLGVFVIVFLIEINCCVQVCCGVLAITTTLAGLLFHMIAQIKNCRHLILEIFDSDIHNEADMRAKMYSPIEYHITIIKYANRVHDAFNTMLFVHVFLTSFILGVLGYQIVITQNFYDRLRYGMHLGGWVALLFLTCFFGQQILTESTTIAEAAYNSKWYNGPNNLKKSLVLMLMRSQKPLALRAATIGAISLQTFVSVIKTAYSYFALLLSITD